MLEVERFGNRLNSAYQSPVTSAEFRLYFFPAGLQLAIYGTLFIGMHAANP